MVAPNATTLPNPYTPMAFFKPATATKITIQNYAAVGSLAVLSWDILLHLPQDYKLAKRYRINHLRQCASPINVSFVIYCIARLTSLSYLMGFVVMITAPVGNCGYIRQISTLYPFTIPLTILPLVMRVSALYNNNKYVVACFSVTWLFVLGSCIAVPIGVVGTNIGTTKYCLDSKTRIANALALFCPFIHDSLIFLATSWAIMKCSYTDSNMTNGIGRHLPAFSKSILRDGQFYYLVTLILNVFFIVLFYIPGAVITPDTIGTPVFVMLNTMSSHVYRSMRFGYYTIPSPDNALQRPDQPSRSHRKIFFNNSTAEKHLDARRDLESGDVSKNDSEEKVGDLVEDVIQDTQTSIR